jgi:hypothetical protein
MPTRMFNFTVAVNLRVVTAPRKDMTANNFVVKLHLIN